MKKRYLAVVMMVCLFAPLFVRAQTTITIRGKVTDVDGNPLPGANVMISNSNLGAASDLDGRYAIFVPSNFGRQEVEILARYMGYKTRTQDIRLSAGSIDLDFSLEVDVLEMDAVVVTGQGYELKKKELTTPITTINLQDIEMAPAQSIDQLVQGRVAGASVNVNTGEPGTGARMRIRGVNSATVSQIPVIYIDGVRVDANDNYRLQSFTGGPASSSLNDILVGDIERVEIIKGGAAATLYGSEAANGVVQIFTRKGKAGAPRWKFSVEQGLNSPEKKFIIEDFTKDYVLENGHFQKYTASVDGGSTILTYHLSGHILGEDGVMKKLDNVRYGLAGGFRAFPSDKLQIDFSSNLVRNNFGRVFSDNAISGILSTIEAHDVGFFHDGITEEEQLQLLDEYFMPELDETVNRFTFATTATYNPSAYLSTRFTLGADYRKSEQRYFIPISAEQVTSTPGGGLNRADREFLSVTLDWAATMKYPLKGWFKSTFTLGAQGFRESDRESDVAATEFGLPGTDDFDNAANLDPRESNQQVFSGGFYFNEQIGLLDRIFVNAGVRFDGNTAFGDEVTLVGYPKFGLAYNVSDEKFWFGGKLFPVLKFRASYGQTGSFPAPFTRDKQFTQGSYLGVVAANFGNPGDPELRPEKTTTLEFGFDAALLDQKIAIEFSLYNDKTTDALFSVPSQPVSGLGFQLRNVGTIENRGIEIALDATVLDMKNARLNIGGSFSTLDNKVTSLGGSTPFNIGGFSFLPLRIEEDHPVGVFQTNVPTGDGDFLANQLIHSPLPDYMFSAFINLSLWKNFRLTAIGSGQTGGQILNTGAVLRYFNGAEPEASMVPEGYNFVTASDVFVEDADFFKIREISMAYTLPVHALGGRYTLSATMRNVLAFAKNRTLDPEMNGFRSVRDVDVGGINFFTLSPPREARLGLIVQL